MNIISDFINQNNAKINENFSVIVNVGPGSFSGIRISIAIAKAMKIVNGVRLFGFKDTNLNEFELKNIELLIKKNLLENNLIKPVYMS